MGLTQAELTAYRNEGFVVVKNVFGPEFIKVVRDAFDRLHSKSQTLCESQELDGSDEVGVVPHPLVHQVQTHTGAVKDVGHELDSHRG